MASKSWKDESDEAKTGFLGSCNFSAQYYMGYMPYTCVKRPAISKSKGETYCELCTLGDENVSI